MGRRSDHSRAELEALILDTGSALMAEVGLAGFSAREVARRIGYSIGTIHNVFGTSDRLITAINTRSFARWAAGLREQLDAGGDTDRIATLVNGYFGFARAHPNLWTAIYDHRLPAEASLSEQDQQARGILTEIVIAEVAHALGAPADDHVAALARSLIATVHGHCTFAISGAWALMGEAAPEVAALARVREALAGHART
ncbi:TetR/AcrR family transcriptional regulator [uncultured Sphingomonas sp.]|uniref:TetR/AcrR family transcriptional regulator n=1 Tax=uncultured Sphingomonas sp. TaxID=158754 RepID=UPI00261654D0|nr:TetR/AcrR family transcriptional regulator [uncultured Sphingomonas sp.]